MAFCMLYFCYYEQYYYKCFWQRNWFKKIYPKRFYFFLPDIFNDYWDDFVLFVKNKNLNIRLAVFDEVNKMRICKISEIVFMYMNTLIVIKLWMFIILELDYYIYQS